MVLDSSTDVHHKTDDEEDQEYHEQEFRDTRECYRDTAKPKDCGQQRDNKEHNSVVQHFYRPAS
jgi:hypothetical protein